MKETRGMMKERGNGPGSLSEADLSQRIRDAAANLAIEGMALESRELEILTRLARAAGSEQEFASRVLAWIARENGDHTTAADMLTAGPEARH